jgi:hypothetical protein
MASGCGVRQVGRKKSRNVIAPGFCRARPPRPTSIMSQPETSGELTPNFAGMAELAVRKDSLLSCLSLAC